MTKDTTIITKITLLATTLIFVGCGSTQSTTTGNSPKYNNNIKNKFINHSVCDKIIDKQFFDVCYSYNLKAAKAVAYRLDGDLVNEKNIKDRPNFYAEPTLKDNQRATTSDYTNSGYDRGHMAPDAAFDWSQESLEATYSLANIIPQIPKVNRDMWVDVEKYARDKAVDLGYINVVNVVKYTTKPTRIGDDAIAVSYGFYKVLYNNNENYEQCYYYANKDNNSSNDKLSLHEVNCDSVSY